MTRVALITGVAKHNGIGAACARRLAADGYAIVAVDVAEQGVSGSREPEEATRSLQRLVDGLRAAGVDASAAVASIGEPTAVTRVFDAVRDRHSRLDVLINNAAAPHGGEGVDLDRVPLAEWDRIMSVNARGTFMMCRTAFSMMREQGSGRIINIASVAGRVGMARAGTYGASKAAVIGLTRSLAVDAAPHGITVNAICPGYIDTNRASSDATRRGEGTGSVPAVAGIPVGRLGRPAEVAALAAFLASEEASYVTAQVISVDGGLFPS